MCDKNHFGIFWDIENCPLTRQTNISTSVRAIREFVASKCRNGNTTECMFQCACDVRKMDDRVGDRMVDVLNKNGIDILHISSRGKVNADSKLIENIHKFAEHHSSDSTLVVITGDSDFSGILRAIQRKRMNLILIYGQNASQDLRNILKDDQCFFIDKIISDYDKRSRGSFGFPPHEQWTISAPSVTTPAHHSSAVVQPHFDHTYQNCNIFGMRFCSQIEFASTASNGIPEESMQLNHLDHNWCPDCVPPLPRIIGAAQKTMSTTQTSIRNQQQTASNQAYDNGFSQALDESQKKFIDVNATQSSPAATSSDRPSLQSPTPTPNNTPQKPQLKATLTSIANVYEKQLLHVLDFLPSSDTKEVLDLLYKTHGDVYAVIDALLVKQHS